LVNCSKCGNLLDTDARFCELCGHSRVPGEGTPTAPRQSARQILLERVRELTASRYDVRGEIGRGGMAAVFLAQDLRLNRRVALKVMLPGLAFTEGMSERFEQEARTAANLDHPNIVTIFGVDELNDLLFFVMKYIEGRSLDRVTKDVGPLPIDVTQFILQYVAMALAYAHDEGVVHRDVKPGNVLLDRRGTPIVTDFGIAKAAEAPSLTVPGAIVGTPAYMSPEQFRAQPAVPASDQYALGIMAYEMLVGEPPFTGSMVELQMAHLTQAPVPLGEVRRDAPRAVADIVMRMLSKQVADRFATLHDVVAALRAIPMDENAARARLVELGFLAGQAAPFGLPETPIGAVTKGKGKAPGRTPAGGEVPKGSPLVAPPPAIPPASPAAHDPTVVAPASRRTPSPGATPPPHTPQAPDTPGRMHIRVPGNDGPVLVPQGDDATVVQPAAASAPSVAYVRIEALPSQASTGEVVPLLGVAYDSNNTPIPGKRVNWELSPTQSARIGVDGALTLLAPGAVTVTATCDGKRSVAALQVTPVPDSRRAPHEELAAHGGRAHVTPVQPSAAGAAAHASAEQQRAARGGTPLVTPRVDGGPSPLSRFLALPASTRLLVGGGVLAAAVAIVFVLTRDSSSDPPQVVQRAPSSRDTVPPPPVVDRQEEPPPTAPQPENPTPAAPTVTPVSVTIASAPPQLRIGERPRLRAAVRDQTGAAVANAVVEWTSSDPNIVSVDANGTARALRPGRVTIRAAVGDLTSSVQLTVNEPRVTAATIAEARPIYVGESQQLRLTVQSDAGAMNPEQLDGMGIRPRWTSSAPETVRLDQWTGVMTAVAPGSASVSVEVGELRASRVVTVDRRAGDATPGTTPITTPTVPERREPVYTRPARTLDDVQKEVVAVLREFSRLVATENVDGLARLYPTMSRSDRESWNALFKDAEDISYVVKEIDLQSPIDLGERARVSLTMQSEVSFTSTRGGKRQGPLTSGLRVSLQRRPEGWRIEEIR